jgi:hypothetical protein
MRLILAILGFIPLGQRTNHLSKRKQRLININTLLSQLAFGPRLPNPLTARQIHQLYLTIIHTIRIPMIKTLHPNTKNAMAPRRVHIQLMRAINPILEAVGEVLAQLLG